MAGNNVIWQPQEVEDLLLYFKEIIQVSGKALVLRELHHEECARRINQKYETNFTWKQVYYKYHKLKGEWKVILEAKSASGASFDDVQKKIIYDEIEVVKMKAKGHKRARFYNVPIPFYDDMEFVFTGKHAAGELGVLQAPFDHTPRHDEDDFIRNRRSTQEQVDVNIDPSQHYDSDTLTGSDSPTSFGRKRKSEDKEKKGNDRRVDERCQVIPVTTKAAAAAAWGMDAPPAAEKAYSLSTEDERREYTSRPPVFSGEKNYGQLWFNEGKKRRQAGQRNPTSVEKMHSSQPCSAALSRNKCMVHAMDPEKSDHDRCQKSEKFTFSCSTKRMCTRFPPLACGAHLLVVPCAGLHDRFDIHPVGCRCASLEEDEERNWRQADKDDREQGAHCPTVKNGKEAAPPEEIFEAVRAIPSLDRTDLLRAYSMLICDDRRFRSLMALPKDMRKDWLLMELGNQ